MMSDAPSETILPSSVGTGGAAQKDDARLVNDIAARVGSLGVEVADVAGNLEDLAARVSGQAAQFEELHQATEAMVAGNRDIDHAAHEAQQAASTAGHLLQYRVTR